MSVDHEGTVLLAGDRELLREAVASLVTDRISSEDLQHAELASERPKDAQQTRRQAEQLRAGGRTLVVVLLDPVGETWLEAADQLRGDERVAILVLAARPSYVLQRVWRQRTPSGKRRASGMLALNSPARHLAAALRAAVDSPGETGFWLQRDINEQGIAQHPAEFLANEANAPVREILKKESQHQTLVMASELPREEVIAKLAIADGTYRERLNALAKKLGANSDVGLGRRAAELGLFVDEGLTWSSDERGHQP